MGAGARRFGRGSFFHFMVWFWCIDSRKVYVDPVGAQGGCYGRYHRIGSSSESGVGKNGNYGVWYGILGPIFSVS